MTKMTSAYANKMLRKLNEDKGFWLSKEKEGYLYVAALDEEPVIPEYDYEEVSKNVSEIDAMQNLMMEVGRSLKPVTEVFLVHLMDKTLRHSTFSYVRRFRPREKIEDLPGRLPSFPLF